MRGFVVKLLLVGKLRISVRVGILRSYGQPVGVQRLSVGVDPIPPITVARHVSWWSEGGVEEKNWGIVCHGRFCHKYLPRGVASKSQNK